VPGNSFFCDLSKPRIDLRGHLYGLLSLSAGGIFVRRVCFVIGLLGFVVCMLAEFAFGYRRIQALATRFEARFPSPPDAPVDAGGSR